MSFTVSCPYDTIDFYVSDTHMILSPAKPQLSTAGKSPAEIVAMLKQGFATSQTKKTENSAHIVIDRKSGAIQKTREEPSREYFAHIKSKSQIFGVLGTVQLLSGRFLVVITKRELAVTIRGHKIYRLLDMELIPFQPTQIMMLPEQQRFKEVEIMAMLSNVLCEEHCFYFSYTYDLTNSFQHFYTKTLVDPMAIVTAKRLGTTTITTTTAGSEQAGSSTSTVKPATSTDLFDFGFSDAQPEAAVTTTATAASNNSFDPFDPFSPASASTTTASAPANNDIFDFDPFGINNAPLSQTQTPQSSSSSNNNNSSKHISLCRVADDLFFWNKNMCTELLNTDVMDEFIVPVVRGLVVMHTTSLVESSAIGAIKHSVSTSNFEKQHSMQTSTKDTVPRSKSETQFQDAWSLLGDSYVQVTPQQQQQPQQSLLSDDDDFAAFTNSRVTSQQQQQQQPQARQNEASKQFNFGIIARVSCKRAGTRFNMRGVDDNGFVANYVETEQFVEYGSTLTSFVECRGSIPLYWSQPSTLSKYTPEIKITPYPEAKQRNALETHFNILRSRFNDQIVAVNLVKKKDGSHERAIGRAYETTVLEVNNRNASKHGVAGKHSLIKYVDFDFHNECKNMNFSRMELLMERIRDDIVGAGYFLQRSPSATPEKLQSGTFRVNCIDCCDRTNVVMTYIAREVLEMQFVKLALTTARKSSIAGYEEFEVIFNNVWADNGDIVSLLYAGTAALMSEFTRTGSRSIGGLLNDGYNSVKRFMLNNFQDAHKQMCVHLVVGELSAHEYLRKSAEQANKN